MFCVFLFMITIRHQEHFTCRMKPVSECLDFTVTVGYAFFLKKPFLDTKPQSQAKGT